MSIGLEAWQAVEVHRSRLMWSVTHPPPTTRNPPPFIRHDVGELAATDYETNLPRYQTTKRLSDHATKLLMEIHHLVVGMLYTNCFLLASPESREAWLIDPGGNADGILDLLKKTGARLTRIINTHAHFDHILAAPEIQEATGATFHLHPDDQPVLDYAPQAVRSWLGWEWGPPPVVDSYLHHGEVLTLGDVQLEVRHTPGHSPGSVIFVDHEGHRAWVGDAIFREGVGRTDLPGGNHSQLIRAINQQIMTLPDDFTLFPGHGPFTSVGYERRHNPFISPDLLVG